MEAYTQGLIQQCGIGTGQIGPIVFLMSRTYLHGLESKNILQLYSKKKSHQQNIPKIL